MSWCSQHRQCEWNWLWQMLGGAIETYTRAGSCVDKLATYRGWIAVYLAWVVTFDASAHICLLKTCPVLLYKLCTCSVPKFLFCLSISASFSCSILFCFSISASFSCSILNSLFCLSISASFSCSWAFVSVLCKPVVNGAWVLQLYSQLMTSILQGNLRTESSAFTLCFD